VVGVQMMNTKNDTTPAEVWCSLPFSVGFFSELLSLLPQNAQPGDHPEAQNVEEIKVILTTVLAILTDRNPTVYNLSDT
jgi:hypothetical protein